MIFVKFLLGVPGIEDVVALSFPREAGNPINVFGGALIKSPECFFGAGIYLKLGKSSSRRLLSSEGRGTDLLLAINLSIAAVIVKVSGVRH